MSFQWVVHMRYSTNLDFYLVLTDKQQISMTVALINSLPLYFLFMLTELMRSISLLRTSIFKENIPYKVVSDI